MKAFILSPTTSSAYSMTAKCTVSVTVVCRGLLEGALQLYFVIQSISQSIRL